MEMGIISQKIIEAKQNKIRQYPVNSWRASSIGHPCERYLIYERTRWQDKKLHDVEKQMIFDLGSKFEDIVLENLNEAGFKIYQQQRDFSDSNLGLTGHIDGMIEVEGKLYPLEIKSASSFTFEDINSYEDLKKSLKVWIRNYPAQLNLYLYFSNKEEGVLLLIDKQTGKIKEIWVKFDWELVDSLLKKVERLNQHLKNNTIPEKLNSPEICLECPYEHICLPEILQESKISIEENSELVEMLKRYEELKPFAKEYEELDKKIKELGKKMKYDMTFVGDWIISRTIREYEVKPQPEPQKRVMTIIKIEKINNNKKIIN